MPISEYRRKIHAIFNNAILHSMDASQFQYETEEEEMANMGKLIEDAVKQGYDF